LLDEEHSQLVEDWRLLFIFSRADLKGSHSLPVNLHRIIQNTKQIFHIDPRKPSNLEPAHIIQSVKDLGGCLNVVPGNDPLSREAQDNAALTFQMHLRTMFASRCVLEQFHLTREALDWVLGEVEAKFNQSLADPGEMCETLVAQSIGEPATQMTLIVLVCPVKTSHLVFLI
jgi:DNA-directed RNA polymerase II subunit RPB1